MTKLIYNVGINDRKYPAKINKKNVPEYRYWFGMLSRCFSKNVHKNQETYKTCNVSDNFKSYSYFYEWCHRQIGFDSGFDLDKDLLLKGNKVYSEDVCVFLPSEINRALCRNNKGRGKCLIGCYYDKSSKSYKSYVRRNSFPVFIGEFASEVDAFQAYKIEKESYLHFLANKWKDYIDIRAYNALISYNVEMND